MSLDRHQTYIVSAIIIMSLVTYLTRVVPFIFFQNIKNTLLKKTGAHLPVCLMSILTIHSIDSLKEFDSNYLINGWIACAVSVFFYCIIRSILASMILGTGIYYFLLHYF
jgi:branched-subunit amino acid transport protein AzlD